MSYHSKQVMEAVCIALGVKADWQTAKVILGDPQLQQKLIEFDRDNVPEQISKRIRRYEVFFSLLTSTYLSRDHPKVHRQPKVHP